jgi:ribosome modulation factor
MTATTANELSQEYHTGYEAYIQGAELRDNPYCAGTWSAKEWAFGWIDAEDDGDFGND